MRNLFLFLVVVTVFAAQQNAYSQSGLDSLPGGLITGFPDIPASDCKDTTCQPWVPIEHPGQNIIFKCLLFSEECNLTATYRQRVCNGVTEIQLDSIFLAKGTEEKCIAAFNSFKLLNARVHSKKDTLIGKRVDKNFQPVLDSKGNFIFDTTIRNVWNPNADPYDLALYQNLLSCFYTSGFVGVAHSILVYRMAFDERSRKANACPGGLTMFRSRKGGCYEVSVTPYTDDFKRLEYTKVIINVVSTYVDLTANDLDLLELKNGGIGYRDGVSRGIVFGRDPFKDGNVLYPTKGEFIRNGIRLYYEDTTYTYTKFTDSATKEIITDSLLIQYYSCGGSCCQEMLKVCYDSVSKEFHDSLYYIVPPKDTTCTYKASSMPDWRRKMNYLGETRTGCQSHCEPIDLTPFMKGNKQQGGNNNVKDNNGTNNKAGCVLCGQQKEKEDSEDTINKFLKKQLERQKTNKIDKR